MTVHHRPRSDSPDKMKTLNNGQNGYISTLVYSETDQLKMSRSWNGLIFHVSPRKNGQVNGSEEILYGSQESPPVTSDSRPKFSVGLDDGEEYSYFAQYENYDNEQEYVTLDNNYIVKQTPNQPYSRHLSMLDFKRNDLNNHSTRSEKIRSSHSHTQVFVDKNKNLDLTHKEKQWKRRSLKKIAENIGSVLTFSQRKEGNVKLFSSKEEETPTPGVKRERSKSVGDLEAFELYNSERDRSDECYSDDDDDVDGDDFGFLSYPFTTSYSSSLCLAMSKSKSPSPTQRILPRIRKSKTKAMPGVTSSMWSPQGNCTWSSVSGRKVVLRSLNLLQLTEAERLTLQKIALQKIQSLNLGCSVSIPKENTENRRHKRAILSFKRSKSANLSSLIDKVKVDKENESKDSSPTGLVFGISLAKCIANDNDIQKKRCSKNDNNDVIIHRREPRKSSSSSQGSLDNVGQNGNTLSPDSIQKRASSNDSLSESDCSRHTTNSSLLDALSLSTSRHGSLKAEHLPFFSSGQPHVPQIVQTCFKHIETYGLHVLGIFRVGASKKRVKQLREEFDSGKDVCLNDTHNAHDVGALLKEYFRDLPEPLLTRDLYSAFVATRKMTSHEQQLTALQYLVSLLPVPNRDTLWALLNFLSTVVKHSTDSDDPSGENLPGNKMDSHNLATLFGPNILNKVKSSDKEFQVESLERAEERKEVIEVVKDMIDNHMHLYEVLPNTHDEVLRMLVETDPESTDDLLKTLSNDIRIEPDPDTTSSSIFEDSDTASLPHSPCSENDMSTSHLPNRNSALHPPLRNSQSEELMTPKTRRRFFFLHSDGDKNKHNKSENNNTEKEKPKFRLRLERSPSPQPNRQSKTRPPKVKISRDTSSPEVVVRRPRSDYSERPQSENFSQSLAIPKPRYIRQSSASSVSSFHNTSSTDSPLGSENSGQFLLPTPPASGENSPRILRKVTSSQQRPLGLHRNSAPTWERERWRQWELLAAESTDDSYEKETLV